MDNKLVVFRGKEIRRILEANEWLFSVVDIIAALTDSDKPRDYWYRMKKREKESSGVELSTLCRQLKIPAAIRHDNVETLEPVFDRDRPIRSTGDMRTWYTAKPCEYAKKSHINFCVFDSTWEASESFQLDRNENVIAWVKNDHIGFEVLYTFQGIVRKYRPDFLVKLKTGDFLVLETKGQDTQQDKTKRSFLDEWVKAVNQQGGFGKWSCAVSYNPSDIPDLLLC